MKSRIIPALFLLLTAASTPNLFAQSDDEQHPLLESTFSASVGAFVFDKKINFRVDGTSPGDEVDFDERWGLSSDETSASVDFRWRFGEKWSLWGQYFKSDDEARATLDEDVHWEDIVFKSGTNVGAGVELSVARLFLGRIFSAGPRHEFGAGVGLHWLEIGAFIEGEVFIDDEATGFQRESVSANAPLPNIGGWYGYSLSPRWLLSARLDWLGVDVGDYSGSLWNSSVGVNFQAFEHVGFSLDYQVFRLDVEVDKSDWRGALDLEYKGPFLSVTTTW